MSLKPPMSIELEAVKFGSTETDEDFPSVTTFVGMAVTSSREICFTSELSIEPLDLLLTRGYGQLTRDGPRSTPIDFAGVRTGSLSVF